MSSYQVEFPDFPAADMPAMPKGFVDVSWHNDAAPAFHNRALRLSIFVDYVDPLMRDSFSVESPRFHIFKTDDEGSHVDQDEAGTLSSDDWNAVMDYVLIHDLAERGFEEQSRYAGDVREFWNHDLGLTVTINDLNNGEERYQVHNVDGENCSERAYSAGNDIDRALELLETIDTTDELENLYGSKEQWTAIANAVYGKK